MSGSLYDTKITNQRGGYRGGDADRRAVSLLAAVEPIPLVVSALLTHVEFVANDLLAQRRLDAELTAQGAALIRQGVRCWQRAVQRP